ncbi:hypothetical protein DPW01_04200 [Aggregatibacter aphrophilus]|nr:hypothetical protein A6J76_008315 [Aggregatibacter aphrophilus]RDE91967.1 hypothetical protein DPW01_04200 [Aggregatibacter aphrophilus]
MMISRSKGRSTKMIKGLTLCQTLCFLWHKVGVFLPQKCGHFSVRFSNLNIANFDRTFLS